MAGVCKKIECGGGLESVSLFELMTDKYRAVGVDLKVTENTIDHNDAVKYDLLFCNESYCIQNGMIVLCIISR